MTLDPAKEQHDNNATDDGSKYFPVPQFDQSVLNEQDRINQHFNNLMDLILCAENPPTVR